MKQWFTYVNDDTFFNYTGYVNFSNNVAYKSPYKQKDVLIPDYSNIISLGNRPNPFNYSGSDRSPVTEICFSLKSESDIEIVIYNIRGQQIKILAFDNVKEGFNAINWDGCDNSNQPVGSGIYLYRISSDDSSVTNKMILMK